MNEYQQEEFVKTQGDRFTIKVIPGAAPIKRAKKGEKPICVDIPPITWKGRNYTRMEIARGANISHSMVSKIFSATRRPGLQATLRLASFFGCSVETLLGEVLPRVEIRRVVGR